MKSCNFQIRRLQAESKEPDRNKVFDGTSDVCEIFPPCCPPVNTIFRYARAQRLNVCALSEAEKATENREDGAKIIYLEPHKTGGMEQNSFMMPIGGVAAHSRNDKSVADKIQVDRNKFYLFATNRS